MKKLLIGGLWEGKVKFYFSYLVIDYQVDIKFNVFDFNYIDVFFLEFVYVMLWVQLDLYLIGSVNGSNYV